MKRFIIAAAVTTAIFALTACSAKTDNGDVSKAPESVAEPPPVSIPTNEIKPSEEDEQAHETHYGNTTGNISNDAFSAQDGDNIYYVMPTHIESQVRLGDLIKANADGSAATV